MKKLLFLLVGFAFICTVRATVDDDRIIEGLPVTVISSGKSYKVFEQYPWEGRSSNYGPKGNRLNSGYGVGVGKNIRRSLELRHGDWIHMPEIGWRQINESSSKSDGIEFFASRRDEYKGKHPRMAIDKAGFALPSHDSTISGTGSKRSGGISGKTGIQIPDAVTPTQMAFTLIPCSTSSKATDLVKPTTPNFAAVYACEP